MAFMKTSVSISKINELAKEQQNKLVQFHKISKLTRDEIVALLQQYKDGQDIGFTPTPELLRKYGFDT